MVILGAGGHAKVIIEVIERSGEGISYLLDDDTDKHGQTVCGYPVRGPVGDDIQEAAIIAIGNNADRKKLDERLRPDRWQRAIHPSAVIAERVTIGEGSVIMAGAVIQPGTTIGRHVIVNTGACIDHDSLIDDYTHIAPGCSLAGEVTVQQGVWLGIGSTVVNQVCIKAWSIARAGSVIVDDVT